MARTFSELWRISSRMYREAAFQSAFVLKRGGQFAQMQSPIQFEQAITTTMWVTKVIAAFLIVLLALATELGGSWRESAGVSDVVAAAVMASIVISAVLLMVSALSLDMTTGFMSSMVVRAMAPLPLTRRELATTSLLAFIRVFDVPLAVGVVAFPVAHFALTWSTSGALAYAAAMSVTEAFAIVVATVLAEFFYTRIVSQGGSWVKNVIRLVFTVVWVLPMVGLMVAINLQGVLGRAVVDLVAANPRLAQVLSLVYPFSFGFLVSHATSASGTGGRLLINSALACGAYAGLAVLGLRWVSSRLRARALGAVAAVATRTPARHFKVRPVAPWLGVLLKDMRIIFRSPSEASLFLMPAAATIPWAVLAGTRGSSVVASAVMGSIVFMSLMVVPVLHNAEAVGRTYTRSLPVKAEWLLGAKAAAGTLTYVASACILIVIAAMTRRADAALYLAFGASGILSAASAALVTALILMDRSEKSALRISPYAPSLDYISAIFVGGFVAAVPSVAAAFGASLTGLAELPLHFAASIGEFAVVLVLVFATNAGRRSSYR